MYFYLSPFVKYVFCFFLFTSFAFTQTVYITKSGKKYHTENCSSLSSSKKSIDLNEALDKGYTPCKKCKPDNKLESTNQNNFIPQKKEQVKSKNNATSQQCEGITKKGTRCKRNAQTGSKYCWQHQK